MTRFRFAAVLGFTSSLILLPVMGSVTAPSAFRNEGPLMFTPCGPGVPRPPRPRRPVPSRA